MPASAPQPAVVINYAGDFRTAAVDASAELLAGTTLDPAKRPYWVTEEFAANGVIPWCLTWRVNEVRYEMRSEALAAAPELVEK